MILVNTFDVEPWWATVPPCVPYSSWNDMPDRSASALRYYLDLCDREKVKCTFFFVGWYARKFPDRVAEVIKRGHEAGCHSLQHADVAKLTLKEFELDTLQAKEMIEDAGGAAVVSYRAPSFSLPVDRTVDFFRVLSRLGFRIDSSVSTARRIHGGGFKKALYSGPMSLINHFDVDIFEIPVPGVNVAGFDIQLFGGGYLRTTPSSLLRMASRSEAYQVLYLHPHDFDNDVPTLPGGSVLSNIRRRVSIGSLETKIEDLFRSSTVLSCGQTYEIFAKNDCLN